MPTEVLTAGGVQDLHGRVDELERELIEAHQREANAAEVLRATTLRDAFTALAIRINTDGCRLIRVGILVLVERRGATGDHARDSGQPLQMMSRGRVRSLKIVVHAVLTGG